MEIILYTLPINFDIFSKKIDILNNKIYFKPMVSN